MQWNEIEFSEFANWVTGGMERNFFFLKKNADFIQIQQKNLLS